MTILIVLLIIIAIVLLRAALLSKQSIIERSITINRSPMDVYEYVRFLKNSDHYNKWVMSDPNKKTVFTGTDGTLGFIYAWDSENKNAGKGEQEIKKLTDNEYVEWEIRFVKPFESVSSSYMKLSPASGNQTLVTWTFENLLDKYLMRLMHVAFNLKKLLGRDMLVSLNNLKAILEK
jgi:uncharacterized protein YndB with AHSA1/START domain